MLTAVALAHPPATSIKMGEGMPWDLLPLSQLSSKPTARPFSLPPGSSWPRVRISAILDKLLGCSGPPEPTHQLLSISPLMWDRVAPGWSHSRMVAGLMGLRAAESLAITAHRHLQGLSVDLGVCSVSITALGPSPLPLQQQHEGMPHCLQGSCHRVPSAPGLAPQHMVQTQARCREV